MGRLHTTHAKASSQVRRGDADNADRYSYELRFRAYRPRYVLGLDHQAYQAIVQKVINDIADQERIPRLLLHQPFEQGARNADWTAQYVREHPTDTP
ncbi:hypothetical protein [Streptomyces sp. NPDC086838]|uniref:hypothetical protein n=1 Tax=Streptomyces sp. NPDC086838 TaxID=3365762 RepID=UPI00380962C8